VPQWVEKLSEGDEFKHLFFKRYLRTILTAIGRRKIKKYLWLLQKAFCPISAGFQYCQKKIFHIQSSKFDI